MTEQARLAGVDSGLTPAEEGWFVVNAGDAAWLANEAFGARCVFEADVPVVRGSEGLDPHRFAELGVTLAVPAERAHGAAVEEETTSAREAYAAFPHWTLGRPAAWDALPWA